MPLTKAEVRAAKRGVVFSKRLLWGYRDKRGKLHL